MDQNQGLIDYYRNENDLMQSLESCTLSHWSSSCSLHYYNYPLLTTNFMYTLFAWLVYQITLIKSLYYNCFSQNIHCPSEETHKHRSHLIAPSSSHYGGRHYKLDKNLVTTKPGHNRWNVVDHSIAGKRHAHCRNSLDSDRAPVSAAVAWCVVSSHHNRQLLLTRQCRQCRRRRHKHVALSC